MQPKRNEGVIDEELRSWLRAQVEVASTIVAPYGPLQTFVSLNPLQGLEHLPFDEAVKHAKRLLGGEGYLSHTEYLHLYRKGRISPRDLNEAVALFTPGELRTYPLIAGSRRIDPGNVLRIHLIHVSGWESASGPPSPFAPDVPPALREDLPARLRARLVRRVQGDPAYQPPASGVDLESHCADLLWSAVQDLAGALSGKEWPVSHPPAGSMHGAEWLPPDLSRPGMQGALGEWCQSVTGIPIPELLNQQMIKWCAAFLDEDQAAWPMPHREQGFYAAWRTLAQYDRSTGPPGIEGFRHRVGTLPPLPEDSLISGLRSLGIPVERWADYLKHHLAQLPGWAGFIRWRSENPDYPWQASHPIDLVQYLAVRISYEATMVDGACRSYFGLPGHLTTLEAHFPCHPNRGEVTAGMGGANLVFGGNRGSQAESGQLWLARHGWRLFQLAQFLGLGPTEVRQITAETARGLFTLLDALPPGSHAAVWQEAYEAHYRRHLLRRLARAAETPPRTAMHPVAQVAFCIDARSEGLRRHLETLRAYETFGVAGFFGVPMWFQAIDSDRKAAHCPVLIPPTRTVTEVPSDDRSIHAQNLRRFRIRWIHSAERLFRDLKGHILTPFVWIEAIGGLFAPVLVGKTVFPGGYHRAVRRLRDWLLPSVAATPTLDPHPGPAAVWPATVDSGRSEAPLAGVLEGGARESGERSRQNTRTGFALHEQVDIVETQLRIMGLTRDFARLVIFCGHDSTSANNPFAASLRCGACGGHGGGPNAKVLATMANRPAVRNRLRDRGIAIPDDTRFLAAEHDTATDRVTLFDKDTVPVSHRDEATRLAQDLEEAGSLLARERLIRLPFAPGSVAPSTAGRHAELRSLDWAQVRPEWGLARNAALVIADRGLTRGIHLDSRCFLHSYDHRQDIDGKGLEAILTGPLIVAAWINLQYYFSSVDNRAYGSGNKVVHNVVGHIGVMLGNRSDLQRGLPLQAVMAGTNRYHEPLRLLTVIQAPADRIASVMRRNEPVQRLVQNGWVTLVAIDPTRAGFLRYKPDGSWEPLPAMRKEPGGR